MPSGPSSPQDESSNARLDSWKEIAAYLGRGERTAKRWEIERALPVHRLPGGGRGSVYAFSAELDEWLRSAKPDETANPAEANASSESRQDFASTEATVSPPTADVFPGDAMLAGATPPGRMQGASWRIPLIVFLPIVLTAVFLFSLRTTRQHPSPNLHQQPARNGPVSSDSEKQIAHDLYLRGRFEWNERTPDSLNRALDDFTQAVVANPNDAESYVGLADTYNLLQIYSTLPLTDSYPRAIAAARRAVQLDDSLAEAHRALAFADFYGAGDYVESEKEFLRAIELNPKDPVTRRWYANAFAVSGRYEESLEQFDKAQELDPASHSTLSDKGIVLFDSGRREEGIALLKSVERTDPQFYSPHFYLAIISFELHDFRTFLDEGQKAAEVRNDAVLKDIMASARAGYTRSGESGLLQNLYTKQEEYYAMGKYSPGMLAKTCVALGKRQEALDLLDAAFSRHEADALWSLVEPDLLTLKDEPRYKALVKKINFPQAPRGASTKPATSAERSPLRPTNDLH
ncbi:MAG: tetratricopeptide repeat protein [Terracidiphilus sp.]